MRAVLHFVASVMMVSGVLLIADAGVTLAWQEPISAFQTEREQAELENDFETPPARVLQRKPLPGDSIGKIELPTLDRSYYIVEGVKPGDLRKGPGHYDDTPLPGDRGTTAIAGHRTTFGAPFRKIDKLEKGDEIRLEMTYATLTYRVEKTRIVRPDQTEVKNKVAYNRLILSACHPLYSAAERIVVFARQVGRDRARVKRRS